MGRRPEKKTSHGPNATENDEENQTVDWSYILHVFAFNYGFTKRDVLQLTRKQIVLHFEHIKVQNQNDSAFEAKLHGFKMNTPMIEQRWEPESNKKLSELAQRRFEEMKKRADEVKGS